MDQGPVTVDVTISHAPSELDVEYVIENGLDQRIWVLDTLVVRSKGEWKIAPDRAIVSRGDPGLARVVLGHLGPESQMPMIEQGFGMEMPPAATALAAKARRRGSVRVPLPLEPWHPYLQMASLRSPKAVVLEIGYLTSEPRWDTIPRSPEGAKIPDLTSLRTGQAWAVSRSVALPD